MLARRRHVYTLPAEVDKTLDGDTLVCHVGIAPGLELHGVHVRLAGVNAPELRSEGGPAAKAFVEALLAPDPNVTLVSSQEDKYGRLLARVLLHDGTDLSELLLAAGHARPM